MTSTTSATADLKKAANALSRVVNECGPMTTMEAAEFAEVDLPEPIVETILEALQDQLHITIGLDLENRKCNVTGKLTWVWHSVYDQNVATEQRRKEFYEALLLEAQDRWATVEEIQATCNYHEPRARAFLEGLVHMREVKAQTFDDGIRAYKLTKFGKRWAGMFMLGS